MINRVLIRIKVIQLLYSYLIADTDFTLLSPPAQPTREKRFAYAAYLDTLYILWRAAESVRHRTLGTPLTQSRFIRTIAADDHMRPLLAEYSSDQAMSAIIAELAAAIKESGLYKTYVRKKDHTAADEARLWTQVIEQLLRPMPRYAEWLRSRENYSLNATERTAAMLDESLKSFLTSQDFLADGLKTLDKSLQTARRLYFLLLLLPVEITDLAERNIDLATHKLLPTPEDLNPNTRFADNALADILRRNPTIAQYVEENRVSWADTDPHLVEILLRAIQDSDIYREYMEAPHTDLSADIRLWRDLFKNVIFHNDDFLESLEDKSIFWNDDIDIIGTFLLKTFRRIEDAPDSDPVLPMYKDTEDSRFGADLFTVTLRHRSEYRTLIEEFIRKEAWDIDRMPLMDMIIILTAISEIVHFPKIPVKASVNEYVEIAKAYSAPKSATFVNGILASVINYLRQQGKLIKD